MSCKIGYVVLIGALLISMFRGTSSQDWPDFTRDINRMTQNINEQVQRFTQGLQAQIHHSVQSSLQPALAEVRKTIENLPRDARGKIITNGNTIIVNSGGGVSRSVISGRTPDGEPYVRDIEERHDGNILYHNETSYNPKTRTMERIRWKLDLATPGSTPEILTDED